MAKLNCAKFEFEIYNYLKSVRTKNQFHKQ